MYLKLGKLKHIRMYLECQQQREVYFVDIKQHLQTKIDVSLTLLEYILEPSLYSLLNKSS